MSPIHVQLAAAALLTASGAVAQARPVLRFPHKGPPHVVQVPDAAAAASSWTNLKYVPQKSQPTSKRWSTRPLR